jgi:hypothetical protein
VSAPTWLSKTLRAQKGFSVTSLQLGSLASTPGKIRWLQGAEGVVYGSIFKQSADRDRGRRSALRAGNDQVQRVGGDSST